MNFADELMGYDTVKNNGVLIWGLRSTIKAMLSLAGEVVGQGDTEWPSRQNMPDARLRIAEPEPQKQMAEKPTEEVIMEPMLWSSTENVDRQMSIQPIRQTDPEPRFNPFDNLPSQVFGNGWLPSHGDFPYLASDFETPYIPRDTFSYQLVERSLVSSYQDLLEDVYTTGKGKNIMQLTSKHTGREPHICFIRWMLSVGRHSLYRAVDFPASRFARWLNLSPWNDVKCGEQPPPEFQATQDDPLSPFPEFLSAMEVQRKLEELGACNMDRDEVELTIRVGSSLQDPTTSMADSPENWSDGYGGALPDTAMKVRLSTSRLINHLASSPVCLRAGPGFMADGLYLAVEASLISVSQQEVFR